jgi:hypothetical protein
MRKLLLFLSLATVAVPVGPAAPTVAQTQTGGTGGTTTVLVAVVGDQDRQLWVARGAQPGSPGAFAPLGGRLAAAPAIGVVRAEEPNGPGVPVYVATGTDNQLWVRRPDTDWRPLSHAPTHCIGNPAAIVYNGPAHVLRVGCRGSDNRLWHAIGSISAGATPFLDSWQSAGGVLTEGPAVSFATGGLQYLVIGVGGRAYFTTGDGGFAPTPWTCKGHPALNAGPGGSWFGCHGTDDALWVSEFDGQQWRPPLSMSGRLVDGVGLATEGGPKARFFVQGTDAQVWEASIESGYAARTPFHPIGGRVTFGAAARGA